MRKSVIECPNCGTELVEKPGRIPESHVAKLKWPEHQPTTKLGYFYECPKCGKRYMKRLTLVEIKPDQSQKAC